MTSGELVEGSAEFVSVFLFVLVTDVPALVRCHFVDTEPRPLRRKSQKIVLCSELCETAFVKFLDKLRSKKTAYLKKKWPGSGHAYRASMVSLHELRETMLSPLAPCWECQASEARVAGQWYRLITMRRWDRCTGCT